MKSILFLFVLMLLVVVFVYVVSVLIFMFVCGMCFGMMFLCIIDVCVFGFDEVV